MCIFLDLFVRAFLRLYELTVIIQLTYHFLEKVELYYVQNNVTKSNTHFL